MSAVNRLDWQHYEINFLLASIGCEEKTKLEKMPVITLNDRTLEIECDSEESLCAMVREVHPAITRTIKNNPDLFAIERVKYTYGADERTIPLFLPFDFSQLSQSRTHRA